MHSAPTLTLAVASALAEAQTACGSGNPTAARSGSASGEAIPTTTEAACSQRSGGF